MGEYADLIVKIQGDNESLAKLLLTHMEPIRLIPWSRTCNEAEIPEIHISSIVPKAIDLNRTRIFRDKLTTKSESTIDSHVHLREKFPDHYPKSLDFLTES